MSTPLETVDQKRLRVAQLQQSALIVDQEISRLSKKRELIRAEITQLEAELAGADSAK